MAERIAKDLKVKWITSRIDCMADSNDKELFLFEASDDNKYYIDLTKTNVASELTAVSLIKDAYLHNKTLKLWWDDQDLPKRRLTAVNLYG